MQGMLDFAEIEGLDMDVLLNKTGESESEEE